MEARYIGTTVKPDLKQLRQYDQFPYPNLPIYSSIKLAETLHFGYETLYSLTYKKFKPHDRLNILLIGCGTFEPYAFAICHPRAHILAIDISAASLKQAEDKLNLHAPHLKNVTFQQLSLYEAKSLAIKFDYINFFGVLHHLKDPGAALKIVKFLLKDDGILRCMVYPKYQRRYVSKLHHLFRCLSVDFETPNACQLLKELIQNLPHDNPLKAAFYLYSKTCNDAEITDAFFHAHQTPFTFAVLCDHFVSSLLDPRLLMMPLSSSPYSLDETSSELATHPKKMLSDVNKMIFLELVGEVQSNFVVIATPHRHTSPDLNCVHLYLNRSLANKNTLYRSTIILHPTIRDAFRICLSRPWLSRFLPQTLVSSLQERHITLSYPAFYIMEKCQERIQIEHLHEKCKNKLNDNDFNRILYELIRGFVILIV